MKARGVLCLLAVQWLRREGKENRREEGNGFWKLRDTAVTMGTLAKGVRDISLLPLLFCSAVSLQEMLPGQPCLHPQLQCQLPNPGLPQGTQPGSSLDWRQDQRLGKRGTRIKWEHLFTPSSINLSTALFVFALYCPPKELGIESHSHKILRCHQRFRIRFESKFLPASLSL